MNRRDFLTTLPALAVLGGCRSAVVPNPVSIPEGSTAFALDLYSRLKSTPGNLFFSPLSISLALAMSARGAAGETLSEMGKVLHLPVEEEKLHSEYGRFIKSLDASPANGSPELRIANALWGHSKLAFRDDFRKSLQTHYGAGFKTVDFNQAEAARQEINAWVAKQTKDKITDLIAPKSLDAMTRLILINAIYFKGMWTKPFLKSQTLDQDFHAANGQDVSALMMRQTAHFPYAEGDDWKALQLQYRDGNLAMLLILPRERTGLAALESKLSPEALSQWINALKTQEVITGIPRFKTRFTAELGTPLSELGMKRAFSESQADFSRTTNDEKLFIASVIHSAYVDVNEQGTEAAAVTKVETKKEAKNVDQPIIFWADHPFLFLIRDTKTGAVLFLGRLENPKA